MKKAVLSTITMINLFIFSVTGQISSVPDKCMNFSGGGQYVEVATNPAFETASTTVEAWIKPQWVSGVPTQLSCIVGMSKPGCSRYDIYLNSNYSGVTIWNNLANLSIPYTFSQNQLYHIAVVFGATNTSLFVNGYLANTVTGTLATSCLSAPLRIGSSDGTKEYFKGNIDEVRIWNVARTSQQIRESMHLVLSGSETGLVSYYQFNEAAGTTTLDAKSGFTGTLMSATRTTSTFPFGGGAVNTQLEALGPVNFAGTNLGANYTVQNGASITVTQINSPAQAYALPSGAAINTVLSNQYWVVNRYGSGSYTVSLAFKTTEDLTAADASNLASIQLYQRNITSDGTWNYVGSAGSIDATNDIVLFNSITSGLGEYIIVRGNVLSCSVTGTTFCAPAAIPVDYDGSGIVFNAGNVFTAQLSNASGSFASPTTIGTLTSTSATGSISTLANSYTSAGTGYRIRVISSNPVASVLSDNGSNLTINNPIDATNWLSLSTNWMVNYKLDNNGLDSGPGGFHGTVFGATGAPDREGNANAAMSFNGTSNYIDMGDPGGTTLEIAGAFTISVWIKRTSTATTGFSYLVDKFSGSTDGYRLYFENATNTIRLQFRGVAVTGGTFPSNEWVHIVGKFDGTNVVMYKNGVQVNSFAYTPTPFVSTASFRVGGSGTNWFGGLMDEINIYRRAISSAEVTELFNNGIAANSAPICEGASFSLSSQPVTGGTYAWTGPLGYTSSVQNPAAITNATPAMAGVYSLVVTKSGCTSQAQNTTVIINPTPAIPLGSDSARCSNGTVVLSASGGSAGQYRWYTVASGGTAIGGQTNSTYTTPSLGVTTPYWVSIVSSSGCESARKQINAIINSPILTNLTTSANTNVCPGDSIAVTVTSSEAGASYQAFVGATPVSSVVSGGGTISIYVLASGLATGSNTIAIKVVKPGCGSANLTNTVSVTKDLAPSISTQPLNYTKCVGQTVTFTVNASGTNITYDWKKGSTYLSNGGNISGAHSSVLTVSNITLSDAANYTCEINGDCPAGIITNSVSLSVSVPAVLTVSNSGAVCEGSTLNLSCSTVAGGIYSWNGPNGFLSTSQNPSLTSVLSSSGTYTVSVNDGICVSTGNTSALVNALPGLPSLTTNGPICSGSTLNLTANSSGATSYSWTGPNSFSSSVQNPSLVSATVAASGSYTVNVSNGLCSNVSSVNVTVNVTPGAAVVTNNGPVCEGSSINLGSTSTGAVTYSWTGPNSFSSTIQNPTITSSTVLASGTYTVTAINGGCSTTGTTAISVDPTPGLPSLTNDGPLCAGGTLSFTANSTGATSFSWTAPNGFTSSLQNPVISPVAITDAGVYTLVASIGSCTSQNTTSVVINSAPAQPVSIVGSTPICENSVNVYSVTNDPNATSYTWVLPSGWMGSSLTNSISATADATSGNISVTATNSCGTSTTQVQSVVVNLLPPVPVISFSAGSFNSTVAVNYQWYYNGTSIIGANSQNYTPVFNGTYVVEVSDTNGCSIMSAPYVLTSVGIAESVDVQLINAFPNPATDLLTISNLTKSEIKIELYSVIGELVYVNISVNEMTFIDIDKFSKGMYLLKISSEKTTIQQQVIFQ